MLVVEERLFQDREIVIAGDTIIEQLEYGHGRGATIQRIASQFLNAIGEEIPCDLGCPADRALDCSGPAQIFVGNGCVDLFLYGSQAVFILGN